MSWRRAIAEVFIVVLSIIIAFGLESWREDQKELREETEFLVSLLEDFETSKAGLVQMVEAQSEQLEMAVNLLDPTLLSPEVSSDSVARLIAPLYETKTYVPRLSSFQSLVASGRLLADPAIQMAISNYSGLVSEAAVMKGQADSQWNAAQRSFYDDVNLEELAMSIGIPGITSGGVESRSIKLALGRQDFRNAIFDRMMFLSTLVGQGNALLEASEEVELRVSEELTRR